MKQQNLKTIFKRGIALVLSVILCFALCACGDNNTPVEDDYEALDGLNVGGAQGDSGNGDDNATGSSGGNSTSSGGDNSGGNGGSTTNQNNDYLNNIPKKLQGTTVTFAAWGDENATEYAKVAKLFTKKTKINVKWVTYNEEKYISSVVEQNAAGKGPDIVITNVTFPVAVEAVQELPKYFDINDGFWDPRVTEGLSVKGKKYFVNSYNSPFAGGGTFVFYNKQIFSNNNIKSPQDYLDKGEWSWENLEKCIREAKQKGFDGGSILPELVWSTTGSGMINYDPKTGTFTSGLNDPNQKSDILAALKLVASLRQDGVISNNPLTRFSSGQMAIAVINNFGMKYNGWFKGISPSALGIVEMPNKFNGKTATYQNSVLRGYGIGRDAKNIEGAYYLLRFFLDIDNYDEAGADIFVNKNIERYFKETYLPNYKKGKLNIEYMTNPLSLVGSPWTQASAGGWSEVFGPISPEEVETNLAARTNIVENAAKKATEKLQGIK